jgi:uncharacterized cupin superfamily protein
MAKKEPYPHILRKTAVMKAQGTFSHPWNAASQIMGTQLGRLAGLTRTGVSLARIAPGKESFAYHLHHTEEEWIYILSGKAVAIIDGQEYPLEAGDFGTATLAFRRRPHPPPRMRGHCTSIQE